MTIGLLADSHGCVEALEAGLDVLHQANATLIFHLGDCVGYFDGLAALDRLRALKITCLLGNHESMLLNENWTPDKEDILRLGATRKRADEETLEWVASLSTSKRIKLGSVDILLVHGSPQDPVHEYVYPDTPLQNLGGHGASVVAMAHTHRPFVREQAGVLYVNVGSCALPRDGSGLGCVCTIDEAGVPAFHHYPIEDLLRRAANRCGAHDSVLKLAEKRMHPQVVE